MLEKEMAAGPETTATISHTDDAIIGGSTQNNKAFATLAAEFAMIGHALIRDERGSLFAICWGQVKLLADRGEAKRFLAQQIGGLQ